MNQAIRNLPVSTHQVIHPDAYPSDQPRPIDIPELAPKLGSGWRDLDVEEVGEEWLRDLLGLRLDPTEAAPAAAGWTGGLYRAWTDGRGHVAVVMRTTWDSPADADRFQRAMKDWLEPGQAAEVLTSGSRIEVLFASDRATLRRLALIVP